MAEKTEEKGIETAFVYTFVGSRERFLSFPYEENLKERGAGIVAAKHHRQVEHSLQVLPDGSATRAAGSSMLLNIDRVKALGTQIPILQR